MKQTIETKQKRVLVCTSCTDFLYDPTVTIGGLNIQMNFWGRTFAEHGWDTLCLTHIKEHSGKTLLGMKHVYIKTAKHFQTLYSFIWYFLALCRYNPDVFLIRGRGVSLYPLALLSWLFHKKLVFFIAADTNMDKGKEAKQNFETRLFRKGIKYLRYIVAQNSRQQAQTQSNYGKNSLIIPNIWKTDSIDEYESKQYDVLWVGNIRNVKRPELYVQLAEMNPNVRFAMVGGSADATMYEKTKIRAGKLNNLDFKGRQDFNETNRIFTRARIYVCTSSSEGFPNTFLQAWSNGIPVVSTVDPSDVVKQNELGIICDSVEGLSEAIKQLLSDQEMYNKYSDNVANYFKKAHDADFLYDRLMKYVNEK